ncbi:hypothetical protein EXIGLDRAFT_721225 [Exidia glandulosa HHB12029]|uniref:Uncharacterized protein n=1 Tax=Exidia glandulosa HHB12029 TaxID=1314781 RepID=A0A165FU52_EXIGL|nr:hypothetical protein EXIGLDRAFT_721225 [Exidia glandulosa HHB12029]
MSAPPTADIVIPPFGRMYLDATWVQTFFFGINCVLFPLSRYVLTTRRQTAHTFLTIVTFILFAFSVSYLGLSIAALHGAFTNPAILATPHGPDLYFTVLSAPLPIAKSVIYVCTVFFQDLLLIWRLYVVWGHRWVVVIIPLIVECAHIVTASIALSLLSRPGAAIFPNPGQAWGLAGWSLDIAVNSCVSLGIAGRLWWMDRQMSSIRANSYRGVVFTVIESGGIFALTTLILFILDACGLEAAYVGIDVVIQLAVLTPLLLIVRVGLGLNHGDQRQPSINVQWVKSSSSQTRSGNGRAPEISR